MNSLQNTVLPPYKRIVAAFVKHELFVLEQGDTMDAPQPDVFADLAFMLYLFFKHDSPVGSNPFVRDEHVFALAREITYYCANSIRVVVHHALKEHVSTHIQLLQQTFAQERPALLPPDASLDELRTWNEQMLAANALDSQQRQEFHALMVDQIGNTFLEGMARFGQMFQRCESPLEEAFLIGLFGLRDSWPRFLDPSVFTNQYSIGSYRVDFRIVDQGAAIIVELDGHTYHERTEDQAVHDRARNRYLQSEGWKVLQFHRREIEENLDRCVQQLNRTLKGLPLAGAL